MPTWKPLNAASLDDCGDRMVAMLNASQATRERRTTSGRGASGRGSTLESTLNGARAGRGSFDLENARKRF